MSMTVSVRVKALNWKKTAGQRRHDLRLGRIPAYVDSRRTPENSVIVASSASEAELRRLCEERRSRRQMQRAMSVGAALSEGGIITFGRLAQVAIASLPSAEQDALYNEAVRRIAERLNTDVLSLVAHRDEASPHAHFSLVAYNRTGAPLSKLITPSVSKELQDIVGEVYFRHGISRGKPKLERLAQGQPKHAIVHRSVAELHKTLTDDLVRARDLAASEQARLDKNRRLAEEAARKLDVGRGDLERVAKRLKVYERRAAEAESMLAERQRELAEMEALSKRWVSEAPTVAPAKCFDVDVKTGLLSSEKRRVIFAEEFMRVHAQRLAREQAIAKKAAAEVESRAQKRASDIMSQASQKMRQAHQLQRELEKRELDLRTREDNVDLRERVVTTREQALGTQHQGRPQAVCRFS